MCVFCLILPAWTAAPTLPLPTARSAQNSRKPGSKPTSSVSFHSLPSMPTMGRHTVSTLGVTNLRVRVVFEKKKNVSLLTQNELYSLYCGWHNVGIQKYFRNEQMKGRISKIKTERGLYVHLSEIASNRVLSSIHQLCLWLTLQSQRLSWVFECVLIW